MKSLFKRLTISILVCLILPALMFTSCKKSPENIYNGEFLEKRLALPYRIEGKLTQNGEQYEVIINGDTYTENFEGSRFRIEYTSGDVTKGLTVEFFDNGVFLYFDDLRFKTNSTMFTNLEQIKTAFEKLGEPFMKKTVSESSPVSGIDLLEVTVAEYPSITAYLNKNDGGIIRVTAGSGESQIILDLKKFETVSEPIAKETGKQTNEVFDVVDDYIED